MAEKSWWQLLERAGHNAPTVKKQSVIKAVSQLPFSFLFSLQPSPWNSAFRTGPTSIALIWKTPEMSRNLFTVNSKCHQIED